MSAGKAHWQRVWANDLRYHELLIKRLREPLSVAETLEFHRCAALKQFDKCCERQRVEMARV